MASRALPCALAILVLCPAARAAHGQFPRDEAPEPDIMKVEILQTGKILAHAPSDPGAPPTAAGEPPQGQPPSQGAGEGPPQSQQEPGAPPTLPWENTELGNLHVKAPNIYLAVNLDEPNNWGYCLDLVGSPPFPDCSNIQGHSCKAEGDDAQFEYDQETLAIRPVNFNGTCSPLYSGTAVDEFHDGREPFYFEAGTGEKGCLGLKTGQYTAGASFEVTTCDQSAGQQFVYTPDRQFAVGDSGLCMVLSEAVEEVGDDDQPVHMMSRDIQLQDCSAWNSSLSTWEVIVEGHTVLQMLGNL